MIDLDSLANIAKIIASLVTGCSAVGAFIAYRKSLQTRHAEWLSALHRQFFESDKYEHIRSVLGYRLEPSYSELRDAIQNVSYHELVNEFWRYLNFFELIANLHYQGEIKRSEIAGLFEFDLYLISSCDFVANAVEDKESKFYRLPLLVRDLGKFTF